MSVVGLAMIIGAVIYSSEDFTLNPFSEKPPVEVSAEQFGAFWPLTVDSGTVDCLDATRLRYRRGSAVFIHDGTIYALNEDATAEGYADIEPLRRVNPDFPEFKMSVSGLATHARQNC